MDGRASSVVQLDPRSTTAVALRARIQEIYGGIEVTLSVNGKPLARGDERTLEELGIATQSVVTTNVAVRGGKAEYVGCCPNACVCCGPIHCCCFRERR